jgi:hypothetical protein
MNLQAEKLEVVRLILDTDDKSILNEVKALFKKNKAVKKDHQLDEFYDGFRNGIHEVKSSLARETELKDAKAWLDELQD